MRIANVVKKTISVLLSMTVAAAVAARAAEPGTKTFSLFDGKTLEGWEAVKCEAEVQDGAILIKSGNGILYTKNQYDDFILELEWKALQAAGSDSGIFFRFLDDPTRKIWPGQYQANLAAGMEGTVAGLKGATCRGLAKKGEWNHFKLTCQGAKAVLEINGKPAWEAVGIENLKGHLGLQAEVPHGGQFLFRNIRLTPLKTPG
jgi:hypothetical protein